VLSLVMWDGRETSAGGDGFADLRHQADDATRGHAQATHALPPDVAQAIVAFETTLHTAQIVDFRAGLLDARGAHGGPVWLARQPVQPGLTGPFDVYAAWAGAREPARARIARGEALFNERTFLTRAGTQATCRSCHDAPNLGHKASPVVFDIGTTDAARRAPELPLYTLKHKLTGDTVQTTDPGRALITGKWKDVGKFKPPVLRALSARAPYFHDGSAPSLLDVVRHYDARFSIGLSAEDQADLVAFLRSL
jgi:cytochrome c peroxidase